MNKKDIVISVRLTESEYSFYKSLIDESGETKSSFFRKLILNHNQPIELKKKKTKSIDYKKILFVFNKASNNINQIAKILNTHAKSGNLDDKKLPLIFNMLSEVTVLMKGNINE